MFFGIFTKMIELTRSFSLPVVVLYGRTSQGLSPSIDSNHGTIDMSGKLLSESSGFLWTKHMCSVFRKLQECGLSDEALQVVNRYLPSHWFVCLPEPWSTQGEKILSAPRPV